MAPVGGFGGRGPILVRIRDGTVRRDEAESGVKIDKPAVSRGI